jgi:hypothetical protein
MPRLVNKFAAYILELLGAPSRERVQQARRPWGPQMPLARISLF